MTKPDHPPLRIVLDTNVLVADAYNEDSASARIVGACLEGKLLPVVSRALLDEYGWIIPRAVHGPGRRARLDELRKCALMVKLTDVPQVVAADPSDNILFATALAGSAAIIVTNDGPVLEVREYAGVRVLRPGQFLEQAFWQSDVP